MGLKRTVFWLLLAATVASVSGRALLASSGSDAVAAHASTGASTGAPADAEARAPAPAKVPGTKGGLATALPFVSEAGAFSLLAFGLAYSRKSGLRHAALMLVAAGVSVWALGGAGVLSVDWPRAGDLFNGYVLNLRPGGSVAAIAADRVSTVVTMVVAYACGHRRG